MLELSSCSFGWRQGGLLESVGDPPAGQVVGRELYKDAVSRKKFDELDADIPAQVGENFVTVGELDLEHVVRERLSHFAFHFYRFFLGHTPSFRGDGVTGA